MAPPTKKQKTDINLEMSCSQSNWETSSLTKVMKKSFGHEWVIENFEGLPQKVGKFVQSSCFTSGPGEEDTWYLKLYPNGDIDQAEGFLSIFLYFNSTKKTGEKTNCQISIVNYQGPSIRKKFNNTSRDIQFIGGRGWNQFLRRDVIFEKAAKLLPNGTLTLRCEIEKVCEIVTTKIDSKLSPIRVPNSTMAHDLGLALQNQEFGDVLFKIGKSDLRAYKGILAARSPVFAGMFAHETMKENQKNQVDITDIDENVFRELLHFIYTDTAPNLDEMPEDLLAAADKYQLNRLKVMCEEALLEKMEINNVIEIFALSDIHSAEKLKNETLKFIKGHEVKVLKTDGYKSLQESNLQKALKLCEMLLFAGDMSHSSISPGNDSKMTQAESPDSSDRSH